MYAYGERHMNSKSLRWEMVVDGLMSDGYARSLDARDNFRERIVI
jgi:hypothetical protein